MRMLYIFWVEKGSIITLSVEAAVDTVNNLKTVLAKTTGIAEHSQVLLINGGESLTDGNGKVARYQSGTDTNPIFLFNRDAIESDRAPDLTFDVSLPTIPDEQEAKESVEAVLNLPLNFNSIVSRTQLAQQYHDFAKELNRQCSVLVQEQHLQHQGWQAVMANLDDVILAFKKRLEKFHATFSNYLTIRNEKLQHLLGFSENIEALSKIPLFPSLIRFTQTGVFSLKSPDNEPSDVESSSSIEEMTILDWISAKDADHSLQAVAEGCRRTIETFDETTLDDVVKESRSVVEFCNNSQMREFKGLAERLFGLDQLLSEAKKQVLEQKETADVLYKMQQTASTSREPQMFKELAVSLSQYLNQILKCHNKLFDIKRRCQAAKQELCSHLHVRLKWVITVENGITEVDDKIKIYYENIKRIKRLTAMLDQVRDSPLVYVHAVEEVLRRRHYADDFSRWADNVSKTATLAFSSEIAARKAFLVRFGSHFLMALFPGLDQFPPQFATSPPGLFDSNLPQLTRNDLKNLLGRIPNAQSDHKFNVPEEMAPCPFICQSGSQSKPSDQQQRRVSFHGNYDALLPALQPSCTVAERELLDKMLNITTSHRAILHRLKDCNLHLRQDLLFLKDSFLKALDQMKNDCFRQLSQHFQATESNLSRREIFFAEEMKEQLDKYQTVLSSSEVLTLRLREQEHQVNMSTRLLKERADEHRLCSDKEMEYAEALQLSRQQMTELQEHVDRNNAAKDKEIAELRAALQASIESSNLAIKDIQAENDLQSRLKEQEFASLLNQEKESLRAELERDHQQHLVAQLSQQQTEWKLQYEAAMQKKDEETTGMLTSLRTQLEAEFSNTFLEQRQLILSELDAKNSRPTSLHSGQFSPDLDTTLTCKDTSKSLSFSEADSPSRRLMSSGIMSPDMELSSSFPLDMSFMSTSQPVSDPLSGSGVQKQRILSSSGPMQNHITLSSCNIRDLVLFVYNKDFKQYTAYLPFKRSLYLLHSDSHVDLSLSIPDHEGALVDVRSWVVAEIVGKEYVLTKKIPNRYRLQIGTKFYRVKAKFWDLESVLKEASLNKAEHTIPPAATATGQEQEVVQEQQSES